MSVIQVNELSVSYGKTEVLHKVSMEVEKGTIYGLVGHNGAGKTTLLRALLGFKNQYQGEIKLFESAELSKMRAKVGAVMDRIEPDRQATALEYLLKIGQMCGSNDREKARELLKKVGLGDSMEKKIGKFSLGMKRRLLIACALVGEPELLILDEPFNGIDPRGMSEMRLIMQLLVSEGMTILVTSHIIPELIKLADVFGVMHQGDFMDTISAKTLKEGRIEKTVIKIHNPVPFLEKMKESHSEWFCLADSLGEVSVFGKVSYEAIEDVCKELNIQKEDFQTDHMTEEEILLWKMEGYGQ